MMKTSMVVCKQTTAESATKHAGSVGVTKPFQNWKKATERMKAHERSSLHTQANHARLVILRQGSVVQQLQRVGMQERKREEQSCNEMT